MNSAKDFRVLVFEIAEKLTYADCETLRFIHGLPEKNRETGAAQLEVLRTLHRQGVFTDSRGLSEVLRTAHREDLVMEVECFKSSPRSSTGSFSCSPVSSEAGDLTAYRSPTQLRGLCDANVAQANSLAAELGRVRESVPRSGLSRETLERLYRELLEVEQALQAALGRCETMMTCCTVADSDSRRDPWTTERKLPLRPVSAPRVNRNSSAVLLSSTHDSAEPTTHHIRSSSCDGLLDFHGGQGVRRQRYKISLGHTYYNQLSLATTNAQSDSSVLFMSRSCSNGRPKVPKKPGELCFSVVTGKS